MTAELPRTSTGVATGYRGIRRIPRVSTASAMAHDTSTVNATVVSTTRAAAPSVANFVVPSMATHGSPPHLPRRFRGNCRGNFRGRSRPLPRRRDNHHERPRKSAAISTAVSLEFSGIPNATISTVIRGRPRPLPWQISDARRIPRTSAEVRGECHGCFRGRRQTSKTQQVPRTSAAVIGHCHGKYPTRDKYHGRPRKSTAIVTSVSAHFGCFRGCFRRRNRGYPWVCPRMFSADVFVGVRGVPWVCPRVPAGVSAGDSVDARGCFRGCPRVDTAGRGCCRGSCHGHFRGHCHGHYRGLCHASAMGFHGVPLLAVASRGSPWNFRGSPWKVRGSPWNIRGCPRKSVDIAPELCQKDK